MGQKTNPRGLRLGINTTWDSRWIAGKGRYKTWLLDDLKIREYLMKKLTQADVAKVVIERPAKKLIVKIFSARPGVIIGKKGQDIDTLKKDLQKMTGAETDLSIVEVRKPELDSKLVADNIARQLEKRVAYRKAVKRAVQTAMRMGAEGIKVMVSGRLAGSDIARSEWTREGRVPLHTLRADVDYGVSEALTTYGIIGLKVWIYKGDIMAHDPMAQEKKNQAA